LTDTSPILFETEGSLARQRLQKKKSQPISTACQAEPDKRAHSAS